MKNILLILIIAITLIGCKQKEENIIKTEDSTLVNKSINQEVSNKQNELKGIKAPNSDDNSLNKSETINIEGILYKNPDSTLVNGSVKDWYENGNIKTSTSYKNGIIDGPYKSWYLNGESKDEVNVVNGKRIGLRKIWYENGQLKTEMNYKNGNVDGIIKIYNEDGSLKEEKEFKDGKQIE